MGKVAPDFDVAIVGMGPVGHVVAALLGQAGHSIGIFDRQASLYPLPRIGHLDHEVMRIVQAVGDADAFEAAAYACESYDWVNAAGQVLIHFDWSEQEATGWHSHYLFYQPDLDAILSDALARLPNVMVNRGWEAVALHAADESASIRFADAAGNGKRGISARYVIGADGANSFVRRQSDMGWDDLGFEADWLVVDYRPNDPDADIDMPVAGQLCDPARPVSMFRRIGHEHCRWEFMLLPGETRAQMEDPARIWDLLARWVAPSDGVLVRHAVYTFRSGLADEWRRGRVLLIGDAAHLMPPFLGQGMGSGFRDAMNLSWKLDLVLRRAAADTLLDSYMDERKPHVRAIIEQAVELGKIVCISDPDAAAERDRVLLSEGVPTPPPFPAIRSSALLFEGAPLAGHMAPQFRVCWQGRLGRADDVIGPGWLILVADPDIVPEVTAPHRLLLDRLGARTIAVSRDASMADGASDLSGDYARFFTEHRLVAIIVRPDFHIFGGASDTEELDAALRALGRGIDGASHSSLSPSSRMTVE